MTDCGVRIEPEHAVSLAEAVKHVMLLSSDDIPKLGKNAACFYDGEL